MMINVLEMLEQAAGIRPRKYWLAQRMTIQAAFDDRWFAASHDLCQLMPDSGPNVSIRAGQRITADLKER